MTAPASLVLLLGALLFGEQQGDGIIRLKPSDFRQLPSVVRRDLDRRGCRVPQLTSKTAPHNVITGSFISAGSRDWAVLCSIKGESRVLVYRGGRVSRVDSLGRMSDSLFLQADPEGMRTFARKLDVATPKTILANAKARSGKPPSPVDHDGIDDVHVEKSSTVRFYNRTRWLELQGAD